MQWFFNMKVGKRLVVSFSAVLLLLVVVGGVGLWGVIAGEDTTLTLLNTEVKLMEHSSRVRANIVGMRRYEKDIFLNFTDADKVADYFKKWSEEEEKANQRTGDLEKAAVQSLFAVADRLGFR